MKPCTLRPASEHTWPAHVGLSLQDALQARPGVRVDERSRFVFQERHLLALLNGRKRSTIRYTPGAIERVLNSDLPVCVDRTDRFQAREVREVGSVTIIDVAYKYFASLTIVDAVNDGFQSVSDLGEALKGIYGGIGSEELVSIFYLSNTQNLSIPVTD